MRQRTRQPDGSWANIPIITGDTMRHGLREAGTYAMLDCAGLLGETLTEEALRLLFAGGMVTGSGGVVRLDEYRELVELLPTLALLGGCASNRVIPGSIEVDPALLVCSETEHLLPTWVLETEPELQSCRAHVEEVQRVRMDPTLDPGKRKLLIPSIAGRVQQRLIASETASEQGDRIATDHEKSSMMPRRFETVCAGSLFYWAISARLYSELDRDALMVMVGSFLHDAKVGGKRGTGHGQLRAVSARNVEVRPFKSRSELLDIGAPVGMLFQAHVLAHAERIRQFLAMVAA